MAPCPAALVLAAAGVVAAEEVSLRGAAGARRLEAVGLNGNWNNLARPWRVETVHASKICVRSVGGFVMGFDVWDTRSNFVSEYSGRFPSPKTSCVEVSDIVGVEDGTPVAPRIFVAGYSDGHVMTAIQSVIYEPGAGEASYTCLGSTSSFYCNLETRGSPATLSPAPSQSPSPSPTPSDSEATASGVGDAVGDKVDAVGDKLDAVGDEVDAFFSEASGRGLRAVGRGPFNGAFSQFAAPWSAAEVRASEVCVRNSAGYGLRFKLWDTETNLVSDFTGDFSAGFERCLGVPDLLKAQAGHPISPRVYVLGYQDGMVQVAQQTIIYDPEAGKAYYTCKGSVGGWWCDRETGAVLL